MNNRTATESTFGPWTIDQLSAYHALLTGRTYRKVDPQFHCPNYEPWVPSPEFPQTRDDCDQGCSGTYSCECERCRNCEPPAMFANYREALKLLGFCAVVYGVVMGLGFVVWRLICHLIK